MNLDKEYWNSRYLEGNTGWDIGYPSTPIKDFVDTLNNKHILILIPGAGNAYEAEYLHRQGFTNVFILDISEFPLKHFKQRVPDFPELHLIQQNFFEHQGQYDLIIEQTFFCALYPALRKRYAKHMHSLLKPQGRLVGLLFDAPMNEYQPPFGGTMREYHSIFEPYFNFIKFEPCLNSIPPRQGKEMWMELIKKSY
ncbi:MAG: TPMT family class I SAM-dependent methyltransferase [Flavobacteriales bacterium]|nr:TPMT family class I SAM-dependent methyltransferase [Flavobacteriales bacterium]